MACLNNSLALLRVSHSILKKLRTKTRLILQLLEIFITISIPTIRNLEDGRGI